MYLELPSWSFPTKVTASAGRSGRSLPVLEALVQGTPVVTSDHAALREAGGALADYFPADAADADQRLADLLDRAIAEGPRWSAADRDAHLATLSWEHSARAMVAAINGRTSPAPA